MFDEKSAHRCFLFDQLGGAHSTWSLAVMAVNLDDARKYVKAHHGKGRYAGEIMPGSKINASCGATTDAAQEAIRRKYSEGS